MVKADASRNYYADLGVSANADENEIRRAFRQLALKYHPDRNPGRESEFVQKFQQIQAAHEILSDPVQRLKYDNERKKFRNLNIPPYNPSAPRARPPPPSRNAPTTTTPSGSYYRPPPPRPQPPPQRPPPQQYPSYSTGADRFTSKNFRAPPPTAQRPSARANDADRANVFTAWQKMKQPRAEEPRPYNPNNPNGVPFGRSKSTRAPKGAGFDPATPGGDEGQARSAYRSNYERPAPSPPQTGDPLKHFKESMGTGDVPYAEANRVRTPYYSTAGERTSMFNEGVGRSSSVRNSPTHGRPASSDNAGSFSDSGRKNQRNSFAGRSTNYTGYATSSDDEEIIPKARPPPPNASPHQPPTWTRGAFPPNSAAKSTNTKAEAGPSPFKSRSEESINMKFSPSDWHGKFEGQPDYFAPNIPKGAASKGRTSPTRGRPAQRNASERTQYTGQSQPPPPPSSFSQYFPSAEMPPPPPGPPPSNAPVNLPAPHRTKFTQEDWQQTFKEASWAFPGKTTESSTRRGSISTTKRPKAFPRKASSAANKDSDADSQSEGPRPKYQAFTEENSNENGEAMDIDSSTPPLEQKKSASAAGGSRTAPTSPQKERSEQAAQGPNGPATEPHPPKEGLNGLGGLRNVAPFAPATNGDGLSGLDDLSATLPFQSKASAAHPTKANTARKLDYPSIPVAPPVPATLDAQSTKTFLTNMGSYVKSWREYNNKMMNHFLARQTELDSCLDDNFVLKRGEPTKKIGFNSYLRSMKEDEMALETWKTAQGFHVQAMERAEEVRNKTLKLHVEG